MPFPSWFLEIWSERSNFMVLGVRGCQMYLPFVFVFFFSWLNSWQKDLSKFYSLIITGEFSAHILGL